MTKTASSTLTWRYDAEVPICCRHLAIADRLWVKSHLDPEEENYGFQTRRGLADAIAMAGDRFGPKGLDRGYDSDDTSLFARKSWGLR